MIERKSQKIDFGGAASSLIPGNQLTGLSSEQLIEADPMVANAKHKLQKIEDKIEFTEKKVAAMLEMKSRIQGLSASLEPLAALEVNGSLTLFGDYAISLTSQDVEDAGKYINVVRIPDDGTSLAFFGVEQQYKIYIKQLAEADSYDFNKSFSSATSALGFSGTLKIKGTSFAVQSNQNLDTIVNTINAAEIGVFITRIMNGDGTYNVNMKASAAGTNSALDLTNQTNFADETDDGSGNRLFGGLTKALDIITNNAVPAQNAIVAINGSAQRAYQTNAIDNALSGLEFQLINQNSDATRTVTITLSKNCDAVAKAITEYAGSWNYISEFYALHTYRKSDGERLEDACLYDESTFDNIFFTLRSLIDGASEGLAPTDLKFLNQIGLVYKDQDEKKDEDGKIIPKYLGFSLVSATSVIDTVRQDFDNVRKIFELDFVPDDSALNLLSATNKLSENKVFNFSLIINNNNLTGSDATTGSPYNVTQKAAITYLSSSNSYVTTYPPVYQVNPGRTGVILKFPSRTDTTVYPGYNPVTNPFEGMTFFYAALPSSNSRINVQISQGSGNKVLNYLKDITKPSKLGGLIDSSIEKLKSTLSDEKDKRRDNEESIDRLEEKARAAYNRKTAQMSAMSFNNQFLTASSRERTKP